MHILTVSSPPLEEHSTATKATNGLLLPALTEPAISAPSLPRSSRERITSLSLNPLIAENHSMKLPGTCCFEFYADLAEKLDAKQKAPVSLPMETFKREIHDTLICVIIVKIIQSNVIVGWGTNEDLIISILGHRNAAQRKLIRKTYFETYGEDLLKALDKELSNDFERLVLLWTLDPAERDAFLANEATKRWASSNQVLMEIACTRSSDQLLFARKAYHARYKKFLEEDVAHHTTGEFRKVLLLVLDHNYECVVKYCTYINVKRVVLILIS
ncbi:uncharacterized protein LOC107633260 [Arachis ipaensis]|uniref:uncharacterized protein LOC107633260 n=1 Tax=Arachis ipaensis TaxID=130454 RepID=UPI000A2B1450|nr:uncharacterized protein LOC107633260 [Arachis ipaensis]